MRRSVLRRVRPLTDAQFGVVTSAQLRAAGVDLEVPRRERWLRLAQGTWLVHDEPDDEQLLEALEHYAPAARASGAIACRWLGVRHAPDVRGCDALVVHGTTLLGGTLLRMHQTRRMPDAVEHRQRLTVPVTRAVADAARWTPRLQDARAVVLAALADRRITADALAAEHAAGPRHTGRNLRRALDDWARGARSAPEAEAADALLELPGVRRPPPFLLNAELWLDGALLGSPDGYVPAAGLGWEMDSVEFHSGHDELDATLQRHRRFADAGFELVHATPKRFRGDRSAWRADVVRRAEQRLERGWRPPSGLTVVARGPLLGVNGIAA
jgi:hypothetical protein